MHSWHRTSYRSKIRQSQIRDIFVCYRKSNFVIEEFVNRLEAVQQSQSGDTSLSKGPPEVEVAITKKISGAAGHHGLTTSSRNRAPTSASEISKAKRGVNVIANSDNSCGYQAIALAKFKTSNRQKRLWNQIRMNKASRLTNLAKELCETAAVNYNLSMDMNIVARIDQSIKPEVTVVDAKNKINCLFIGGPAPTELFIEYMDNNYNSIINIRSMSVLTISAFLATGLTKMGAITGAPACVLHVF